MNDNGKTITLDQLEDIDQVEFEDLFNIEEIQAIQDAFAQATGVASLITRPDGTPLTQPSNFCRLCMEIIRETPVGLANCIKSDAEIGRPNPDGPNIQPCLSGGFLDGGASIMIGDRHVANWLIGQVLTDESDMDQMLAYAQEIEADEEVFRDLLQEPTRMPRQQFEQVAQTLFLFAKQLSKLAVQNFEQKRLLAQSKQAEVERDQLQQEVIEAQKRAILELSTPIIPVMDRIIVMPLIGSIDSLRARDITRTLLAGISQHRAKVVILDVTGVGIMDTGIVNHLNKTIQAARLKGAQTIITGISDAVAEAIVDLGIDWSGVQTLSDLQTGLTTALTALGLHIEANNLSAR
jgi:anti-anti-sigma regulatory factor/ligand-binding sensor protein